MDFSKILDDVQREAIDHIRHEWALTERPGPAPSSSRPPEGAHRVRFDRSGWIQQIDIETLRERIPEGSTMWVDAYPGRYAVEGTPLCALSPTPDDADSTTHAIRATVSIGDTRSMQQDVSFGLRQLADVALKGLSPGINDPTTAQDAIFHTAAVLAEILRRDPPVASDSDHDDQHLILTQVPTHEELVHLAFDEIRRAAVAQPTVAIYLLEALGLLKELLTSEGLHERCRPLTEQAALILAGSEQADVLPADRQQVERIYAARFPSL
jgi:uncharacterized membrane protein